MNLFNDYTALYFFSAAFQGNIALLALSGLFVTYRLQMLRTQSDNIAASIATHVSAFFTRADRPIPNHILAAFANLDVLKQFIDDEWKKAQKGTTQAAILNDIRRDFKLSHLLHLWKSLSDSQYNIRTKFQKPLVKTTVAVIAALVLLPLSSQIHTSGQWAEGIVYFVYISVNAWAILDNVRMTKYLLVAKEYDEILIDRGIAEPDNGVTPTSHHGT
jgi:hypothetical protein